jgi:DNA-binding response OmpR family regulator
MNPETAGTQEARPTVLVVEDEEAIRSIVRTVLEMNGHRVLSASDAEEALRLSEQHAGRIDLVVTDVHLPGADGGDLAGWLLDRWPGLRVLYISGLHGGESALPARAGGPSAFLAKPFTPRELLATVRRVLGSG